MTRRNGEQLKRKARPATILIVEDSPVQAELLRRELERAGYGILMASNGAEGLAIAKAQRPDAVVSDINMPLMDGYAMCHAIRCDDALKATPVILLTMLSDPEDVIHGLNAGADAYVTKPYNIPSLIARVALLIAYPPTPPPVAERRKVEIKLAGETYRVDANGSRMLNLLVSTYENAVLQNRELAATQQALEELNQHLEQKVLEQTKELRESEQCFRALIENATDLVLVIDAQGKITYASPSIKRVGGFEPDELLNKSLTAFVHPDDLATALADLSALVHSPGKLQTAQLRYRGKEGVSIILETVAKSAIDDPVINGIIINARDVTERLRAEGALRDSEQSYRTLADSSPALIWASGTDKLCNYFNQPWLSFTGRTLAQEFGNGWAEGVHPDDMARCLATYTEAFDRREPFSMEYRLRQHDGEFRWIRDDGCPRYDSNGNFIGYLGYVIDITARKQNEQALERVNRALRTLSACNMALVHSATEADLLDIICRLIVETGGYRMAWVGFAEQDPEKTVRPVAHFGHEDGYLAETKISWADTEFWRGSTGTAIRTGVIQVNMNFQTNPAMAPWREAASRRDYQSSIALPLKSSVGILGALTIYASAPDAFNETEVTLLEELAADLTFGVETLRTRVERDRNAYEHQHHEEILRKSLEQSIQAIADTVEARDPYTAGHERRVAELAAAIAREMGLAEERVHGIRLAASIHDLGKIQVPAEILAKPGKLTAIEFMLIKTHPEAGYDILKDIEFPWPIADMVRQHHERMDGSGYPQGLKDGEILFESRILTVADVMEAMASHRPYRPAMGGDLALKEIERGRGSIYDPAVADACLKLFREGKFAFSE